MRQIILLRSLVTIDASPTSARAEIDSSRSYSLGGTAHADSDKCVFSLQGHMQGRHSQATCPKLARLLLRWVLSHSPAETTHCRGQARHKHGKLPLGKKVSSFCLACASTSVQPVRLWPLIRLLHGMAA